MAVPLDTARACQAIANLSAWLDALRQPGGYGGPVAHWWQSVFRYTGPGLDWRYEGILAGYAQLLDKTGDPRWRLRLRAAADDLVLGQLGEGGFANSAFERNPGLHGTPHEAAAALGLLGTMRRLDQAQGVRQAVERTLDRIVAQGWNPTALTFTDGPDTTERVPNKLATLARAFMAHASETGDTRYLTFARACLDDIRRSQSETPPFPGAIHQVARADGTGDGRFFPFYNARCVEALLEGARVFGAPQYRDAAAGVGVFLLEVARLEGTWPQVVYARGGANRWPVWVAGTVEILTALAALDMRWPDGAVDRVLDSQLASGGFPTAEGFASQITQRHPGPPPDYRDLVPVAGWNAMVFRFLARRLPSRALLPPAAVGPFEREVRVGRRVASLRETGDRLTITSARGEVLYHWAKSEPWARVVCADIAVR